ncbi:YfbU family protein (plasmid) [Rhizobium sp. TH2]|uniref:YfbU family protein n=1 Tax=Rhizobium sp. TH2 TaxID=2775403 RepID=UPI0021582BC2|nr:YfbU family protein [Rhizobium sp. TH2]UVC12258.1 YfbU family protein [Rhizobium sp. TH2]
MVPKTERMELRLDAETIEQIDAWRGNQEDVPSRSEAVRRLIEEGLQVTQSRDFRPSQPEKLMTWMLAQIMRNQINERKEKRNNEFDLKDIDLIEQAIYGGHFWALDWEMTGVLHNHIDDRRRVSLVVDVMDMWTFIERAYEGYTQAEKDQIVADVGSWAKNPQFHGFDGNNEGEYCGIASFLVDKLNRFESFKGRSMNSHSPTVVRYGRMATVFEQIRPNLVGRELTVGEMTKLLKREVA